MPDTLFVGDDGANTVAGGAGDNLIYGFDPNGPQANVSSIAATRVAAGLAQPVFVGAPPGDLERLFRAGASRSSTWRADRSSRRPSSM